MSTKKPRDLPPLDLGSPVPGESPTLEIKRRPYNDCGLDERPRQDENEYRRSRAGTKENGGVVGCAYGSVQPIGSHTQTFREHRIEADQWADKGAKGRVEEWVDTTRIAGQEVTGVCGFWDGSNDNGRCGRGIVLMALSEPHGWFTFYKKRGPEPVNSFLDAETGWMRDAY